MQIKIKEAKLERLKQTFSLKGDGGGPLACPVSTPDAPDRYIQTGIVAWGISCGDKDVPGVYTDVTKYRNWIDKKMDQYGIDKNAYTL